jgi:hypothetical protein
MFEVFLMSKFNLEVVPDVSFTIIKIFGHLDEEFIQSEVNLPPSDIIRFDLAKLDGINSCGIREFISLLKRIPLATMIEYHNCPTIFIIQVNMVNGFLGQNRKVISLFAPYVGIQTENEALYFYEMNGLNTSDILKVIKINDEDHEFDGSIEKYFRFLSL